MKTWKLLIAAGLMITSLSTFASTPEEGNDHGNGGDDYSREFVNLGYDIVESIMQNPLAGVDSQKLFQVIQNTKVNSELNLQLNGYEVDAINYPGRTPPQIVLSRQGWDRMKQEPHRKAFLVLHEYLGIMGLDDSRYQISHLLDRAGVCTRTQVVKDQIEKAVSKFCYRITNEDLYFVEKFKLFEGDLTSLKRSDFSGLVNLKYFELENQNITYIEDNFFADFPQLSRLVLSPAIRELDSCYGIDTLTNLTNVELGKTFEDRYIKKIPANCFSQSKNLKTFYISLDGARFSDFNLFSNLEMKSGRGSVYLSEVNVTGINLDQIPLDVLKKMLGVDALGFRSYDQKFSPEKIAELSRVLGANCYDNNSWSDDNGKTYYSTQCRKTF